MLSYSVVLALHQVREFQCIPRLLGVSKHIKTGLADFCLGAQLFVKTLEKSLSHHLSVVGSLAEGRNLYREHIQAIVEISPKLALFGVSLEILMHGGDDAHIILMGFVATYPFKAAFLKHAQQFDLHALGHVSDFIEE